jgi:hypothetical protein
MKLWKIKFPEARLAIESVADVSKMPPNNTPFSQWILFRSFTTNAYFPDPVRPFYCLRIDFELKVFNIEFYFWIGLRKRLQ